VESRPGIEPDLAVLQTAGFTSCLATRCSVGRGEGESNPHPERGMLGSYRWKTTAWRVVVQTAGVEPTPPGWKPGALPLGHACERRRDLVGSPGLEPRSIAFTERRAPLCHSPRDGKSTERAAGVEPASAGWGPAIFTVGRYPRRAARETCTRHPLYTRQGPRSLGLSSVETKGGTGRSRTDHLLTAGQALSQMSYGPRDEAAGPRIAPAVRAASRLGGESADERSSPVGFA
jgi:hypothetical protein